MSNNCTANITALPSIPKPLISKEVIAENIKLLIEQLEAGHSEGLTAYLTAMGRFHSYSFGNISRLHDRSRTRSALLASMRATSSEAR